LATPTFPLEIGNSGLRLTLPAGVVRPLVHETLSSPFICFLAMNPSSQPTRTCDQSRLLKKGWPASWIAHPTASPNDYGGFPFSQVFNLEERTRLVVVHLSPTIATVSS